MVYEGLPLGKDIPERRRSRGLRGLVLRSTIDVEHPSTWNTHRLVEHPSTRETPLVSPKPGLPRLLGQRRAEAAHRAADPSRLRTRRSGKLPSEAIADRIHVELLEAHDPGARTAFYDIEAVPGGAVLVAVDSENPQRLVGTSAPAAAMKSGEAMFWHLVSVKNVAKQSACPPSVCLYLKPKLYAVPAETFAKQ
jgi:hypothetical protein